MPPESTALSPLAVNGNGRRSVSARNPLREYVAGTEQNSWSERYYRTLPHYIDDTTRDFGDDLYERMLLDPQVSSCVHLIKTAILAAGLHFTAAVDDKDPDFDRANDLRDFCERAFEGLGEALHSTLYDLLDALPFGNRVAEIVLKREDGRLTLAALKPKPRRVTAFLVDPWQNLVGLLAVIPGQAPFLTQGTIIGDPAQVPNLLPRERFLVLTFRVKDGDPRGQSILRPAYNPWWVKQQVWPEYLKYLAQFANPSIVGEVAPDAVEMPAYNDDGTLQTEGGETVFVQPQDAMLTALQEFRNSGILVLPNGAKATALEIKGDGAVHRHAIDLCDRQISKAILGQTLATEEGVHQARAAADIHQDTLGLVIGWGKKLLEGGLAYVCRRLVLLNYGPDAMRLTPMVTLSETEKQDFPATAGAVARLQQAGYFAPSQLAEVDALLNLPVRTPEEVEVVQQAQEQALSGGGPGAEPGDDEGEEAGWEGAEASFAGPFRGSEASPRAGR